MSQESLAPQTQAISVANRKAQPWTPAPPKLAAQARLFRMLWVQYQSGITFEQAIAGLMDGPGMGWSVQRVYHHLQDGYSISASFRKAGFSDPVIVPMLALGERTGQLDRSLSALADLLEWRTKLRSELSSRLVYPLILSAACVLLVCLLPVVLSGPMLDFLQQSGQALPRSTEFLIGILAVVSTPWFWVTAMLFLIPTTYWVFWAWRNKPAARERLLLRIPGISAFLRAVVTARFSKAFLSCHQAGYPLLSSLELSARCAGSPLLESQAEKLCQAIASGKQLEKRWGDLALLEPLVVSSLKVGSSTGRLEQVLGGMIGLVNDRIRATLDKMLASLEPLLLATMGLMVGAVIIATASPMSSLLEGLM